MNTQTKTSMTMVGLVTWTMAMDKGRSALAGGSGWFHGYHACAHACAHVWSKRLIADEPLGETTGTEIQPVKLMHFCVF